MFGVRGAGAALLAALVAASAALWLTGPERRSVRQGYGVAGSRYQPALVSRYGAVASASPDASAAGVSVLAAGGNAVDAAVATVFAVGVAAQESCGIGGGGFLLYRGADGTAAVLDFRETAPAGLAADFEAAPRRLRGTGLQVVGVPGTVAGMAAVAERFGTRPLARLLRPAIDLADRGLRLSPFQIEVLESEKERLNAYDEARRLYLDNGEVPAPFPIGHERPQPDLARTLRTLAEQGPAAFYQGSIGGRPALVLGAPGGPRIPMGVATVISDVLDFGMDPALAVDVARLDTEKCCTVELEQDRVPLSERNELTRRGHTVVDRKEYHPQFTPLVQVTGIRPDGRRFAVSDPRYQRGPAVL